MYIKAFLFLALSPFTLFAQNFSLTLKVDMRNEIVSPQGIHVAGNFQSEAGFAGDWDPSTTLMTDANTDGIYEINISIPAGTYEYKFINGNSWTGAENPPSDCSVGSTFNRQLSITNNLVLPTIVFNQCNAQVLFSVNMRGKVVSPNGIHVMGDFQTEAGFANDWNPSTIKLEDLNGDSTYEISLAIATGNYHYLFVNGNTIADAENILSNCSSFDSLTGKQVRTFSALVGNSKLPSYCFSSCEICDPSISTNYKTHWWNDAVFYELFVRSFYDSNNDGIGDFQGIIQKLNYLNDGNPATSTDLGITALWLMPMMASPSYHGYDVTDYYATEPDYGTMADFQELIDSAHAHGIKIIIDFVMNHTSNQHPWFMQSATSSNGYRDWYVWKNTNPGFTGPWGQNVWHSRNGSYYYGLFYDGMPDLNYEYAPVKQEIFNVSNFWLNKGVDGFRLDAVKYLDEDGTILENTAENFNLLHDFNTSYKSTDSTAYTIGEVWSNTASVIPYVQNNRLDNCFEFELAGAILNGVNAASSAGIRNQLQVVQNAYPRLQMGTFLTNHDMDRVYTQLASDTSKMKLAASLYLTMPGVPYIYYGEELGMIGSGADENKRKPMQWTAGANSGFSAHNPWNALGANYLTNNVASMSSNNNSLLNHYKKLIQIRNNSLPLRRGYLLDVQSNNPNTLAYARVYNQEAVLVISNFDNVSISDSLTIPISSLTAGIYNVKELFSDQSFGTIEINSNGGFSNWQALSQNLKAKKTWILQLVNSNANGIVEFTKQPFLLTLKPNPAKENVIVNLKGLTIGITRIEIYDVLGKRIHASEIQNLQKAISLSNWNSGLYFVKVTNNNFVQTERLFVE